MKTAPHRPEHTGTSRLAYDVDDIRALTGFGRSAVFEAFRKGQLVRRKLGRRTFVLHEDLVAWLNSLPTDR